MLDAVDERDTAVFHRYAEYLWRRAGGIVLGWTIGGTVLGGILGSLMLTPWANWPLHHHQAYLLVALGAVAGGVLGRSIGTTKAMGLRLQAELAQHQLQFERSTLARAAEAEAAAKAPPPAPLPYLPAGVPPVSAVAAPEEPEGYGWAAMGATGS
jgi:MFS family permease